MTLQRDNGLDHLQAVASVYLIFNVRNGRVYVGWSSNVRRRCRAHYSALLRLRHLNHKLNADARDLGADSFAFVALPGLPSEGAAINLFNACDSQRGYNLTTNAAWSKEACFLRTEDELAKNGSYRLLDHVDRYCPINPILLNSWESVAERIARTGRARG